MPAVKTPKKSTRALPIRRVRVQASPVPGESSTTPEGGSSVPTLPSSPIADGITALIRTDTTVFTRRTRLRTPTPPPPFATAADNPIAAAADAPFIPPTTPRGRTSRAIHPPQRFDPSPEAPRAKARVSSGGKNGSSVISGGSVALAREGESGKVESKGRKNTVPSVPATLGVTGGAKAPARSHKKGMGKAGTEKRRLEALAAATGGTIATAESGGADSAQKGFSAGQSDSQVTEVRFATSPPAPPAKPKRARESRPRRPAHPAADDDSRLPLTYTHMEIGPLPGQRLAWNHVDGGWGRERVGADAGGGFPPTFDALAMLAHVAGMAERLPVFA